jgi:hypothetical protein
MLRAISLAGIKPGDVVTRWLAGIVPMELIVTEISDHFIHCGSRRFDRNTGGEIDDGLDWDGICTGSFITRGTEHENAKHS